MLHPAVWHIFWTRLPITISSSKLGSPGGGRAAVSAARNPDLACLTKLHFDCVQPLYTWLGAIIWHYYFLLQLKRHFVRIHAPLVIWISSRCALIFRSGIWPEIFLHCRHVWCRAMLCFIVTYILTTRSHIAWLAVCGSSHSIFFKDILNFSAGIHWNINLYSIMKLF